MEQHCKQDEQHKINDDWPEGYNMHLNWVFTYVLPEEGLHRYPYQPGEQNGVQKRQAIYFIWSQKIYRLDLVAKQRGNHILCYLEDVSDRAFLLEELMYI